MEGSDIRRKLATILVADIVGYSRLTANDEDWTIRALGEFRGVVDQIITRHEGRIFSTGGDSILAEFASPVEAVRCAVDFQEAARSRNLMQPRDRQLRYRIGINLGDVMIRGNDLLGDGVNVAARLEGIAEPGGICVSGTVWDHINGKLSIGYVDIGEQSVKNIPRPVRAYHLRVDGTADEAAPQPDSRPPAPPAPAAGARGRSPALAAIVAALVVIAIGAVAAWQFWPRGNLSERSAGIAPPSAPIIPPAPTATPGPTPAQRADVPPPPTPSPSPSPTTLATAPPTPQAPATTAPTPTPGSPPQPVAAPTPAPAATPAPVQSATTQPTPAAGSPPKSFRDCSNCPVMVVVPAGNFMMGAPPGESERLKAPPNVAVQEQPQHAVTIAKPFALAKFAVTRAEFAAFAKATGFQPAKGCIAVAEGGPHPQPLATWEDPGFAQSESDPVVCMNATEADAYLAWLRRTTGKPYRLASEAEWEYAARGGTTTAYYWGDDPNQACTYENIADATFKEKNPGSLGLSCRDGFADTSPVGSFKPNPFGLYDMLGNVRVLTADCWNDSYAGAPADGSAWMQGDCTRRAVRGGTFGNAAGWMFRAANRLFDGNLVKRNRIGFRVALSLQ